VTIDSGAGIGRLLYGPEEIAAAVRQLAGLVAADHRGKPLVLLGVLKGALYFTVDLSRALSEIPDGPSEIVVDYLSVISYGPASRSSGRPRLLLDETTPLEGRHVVIAEDIADNGLTLEFLQAFLRERNPASLRTCVLFDKPSRRQVPIPLDYVGLTVPDAFVVGYGLDYQERYRNLPYLAQIEPPESQL
jgi:hypoxanthine phosphoribosyltransferase